MSYCFQDPRWKLGTAHDLSFLDHFWDEYWTDPYICGSGHPSTSYFTLTPLFSTFPEVGTCAPLSPHTKGLTFLRLRTGSSGSKHRAGRDWMPLGQQSEQLEWVTPLFVRTEKASSIFWGSSHSRLRLLLINQFHVHLKNLTSHSPATELVETMFRLTTLVRDS